MSEGSRGGGFLTRTLQLHLIGEREAEIIREIAATLEVIDGLQAALDKSSLVDGGRPNPILVELRQQRLLLAKLMSMVPPPVETSGDSTPPPSPRTIRARKAAESRWAEHRRIRGAVL